MMILSNRRAAALSRLVIGVIGSVSPTKRPLTNFPAGPQNRVRFTRPRFESEDFAGFCTLPARRAFFHPIALAGPQPPSR
jgi:hypothetical protein